MKRILLYGATGYSGCLIAREAARRISRGEFSGNLTLASRDAKALTKLASELGLPCRQFGLDDRLPVVRALDGFDVVLNAAGPFARTATRLAKAALDRNCHYVDLNSEVDVYNVLDDLGPIAALRGLTMVSGAGWSATAADVLLDYALSKFAEKPREAPVSILRIAFTRSRMVSRGSALTAARAVREQVSVVRAGKLTHVPVGLLERTFDFGISRGQRVPRITSAINALETRVLHRTLRRYARQDAKLISSDRLDVESYLELNGSARLAYSLASAGAAALYLPFAQRLVAMHLSLLPEGPRDDERKQQRSTLALTIEDAWSQPVAKWVLETPNCYDFTARSALEIALELSGRKPEPRSEASGWQTPSAILSGQKVLANAPFPSPFQGSVLFDALTNTAQGAING